MTAERGNVIEKKLDRAIELLQHLVALELSRRGASKKAIGKNIRVAEAKVVKMLSGLKKEVAND